MSLPQRCIDPPAHTPEQSYRRTASSPLASHALSAFASLTNVRPPTRWDDGTVTLQLLAAVAGAGLVELGEGAETLELWLHLGSLATPLMMMVLSPRAQWWPLCSSAILSSDGATSSDTTWPPAGILVSLSNDLRRIMEVQRFDCGSLENARLKVLGNDQLRTSDLDRRLQDRQYVANAGVFFIDTTLLNHIISKNNDNSTPIKYNNFHYINRYNLNMIRKN